MVSEDGQKKYVILLCPSSYILFYKYKYYGNCNFLNSLNLGNNTFITLLYMYVYHLYNIYIIIQSSITSYVYIPWTTTVKLNNKYCILVTALY